MPLEIQSTKIVVHISHTMSDKDTHASGKEIWVQCVRRLVGRVQACGIGFVNLRKIKRQDMSKARPLEPVAT